MIYLLKTYVCLLLAFLLILLLIYGLFSVYLNNFNKLKYNKETALAWIPVCNIYLLGKLTFNKYIGIIYVILLFLNMTITVTINEVEKVYRIIPKNINNTYNIIYSIILILTFIYSLFKYRKLKINNQ